MNERRPLKEKSGRPRIFIDWEKVKNLLLADCTGVEIAGYFGVHPDTLYDRCVMENNISFSDYSHQYKHKGDSLLRATQFEAAIKDKDKTMLVWLGKQRLGQRDRHDVNHAGNIVMNIIDYTTANSLEDWDSRNNAEYESE
jgi:hypothetical protein